MDLYPEDEDSLDRLENKLSWGKGGIKIPTFLISLIVCETAV